MISPTTTILRINKLGKPYVQSTDPSLTHRISANDIWLNPVAGTMKTWNGSAWEEMQFGASAIMDDCIANRMLANDISANKITAGILKSNEENVYINLENGEARLLKLELGGEVEGNIIATSSNGLTRVRLRGKDGDRDITAALVLEQRTSVDAEWENAGQIYFAYNTRRTYSVVQNYEIGSYNSSRPTMGYNAGSEDGLMWRMLSTDWLKAAYVTYHGTRLVKRNSTLDLFEDVNPVNTVIGNCMSGTNIAVNGVVTCTYKFNDVMQLDFNLKVTTAGSGSASYGISPTLLRTLNADIPAITPQSGGTLQVINSSGAMVASYVGASMIASNGLWTPASVVSGALSMINESSLTSGVTLIGTCYGKYDLSED